MIIKEKLNTVIHTGREDMCSHYVGAPRYACPDSVQGKREGMEIIY